MQLFLDLGSSSEPSEKKNPSPPASGPVAIGLPVMPGTGEEGLNMSRATYTDVEQRESIHRKATARSCKGQGKVGRNLSTKPFHIPSRLWPLHLVRTSRARLVYVYAIGGLQLPRRIAGEGKSAEVREPEVPGSCRQKAAEASLRRAI